MKNEFVEMHNVNGCSSVSTIIAAQSYVAIEHKGEDSVLIVRCGMLNVSEIRLNFGTEDNVAEWHNEPMNCRIMENDTEWIPCKISFHVEASLAVSFPEDHSVIGHVLAFANSGVKLFFLNLITWWGNGSRWTNDT